MLQSVTDKVQKPCYCLCYSLLLTKSKLEEVLLGPQEALTSCRQMMKLWKEIHEIEDEEWVTDIDSLFSICAYLHFNAAIVWVCVWVCVCMSVCMRACMFVCVCMCTHVHIGVGVGVWKDIHEIGDEEYLTLVFSLSIYVCSFNAAIKWVCVGGCVF